MFCSWNGRCRLLPANGSATEVVERAERSFGLPLGSHRLEYFAKEAELWVEFDNGLPENAKTRLVPKKTLSTATTCSVSPVPDER